MVEASLFLSGGLVLLVISAEGLVRGSSSLALRLGMTPLLVGLTVVAFGTSAPELVASLRAALAGSTDMALGNVIGSNISNIALVLGLSAVIRPIQVPRKIVRVDARIALAISVVLVLMLLDGRVNRYEGAALFTALIVYIGWSVQASRGGSTPDSDTPGGKTDGKTDGEPDGKTDGEPAGDPSGADEMDAGDAPLSMPVSLGLTLAGLVGLAAGADFFVKGGREMAMLFGVSEAVIGLTVMAVGTSLPEIATVVAASLRGLNDLITGNAIGSNIFNVLCVVGLSALIIPLSLGAMTVFDLFVFLGMSLAILITMQTNLRLSRAEGIVLIVVYFLYVGSLFVQ